jgi:hypothetical protein
VSRFSGSLETTRAVKDFPFERSDKATRQFEIFQQAILWHFTVRRCDSFFRSDVSDKKK